MGFEPAQGEIEDPLMAEVHRNHVPRPVRPHEPLFFRAEPGEPPLRHFRRDAVVISRLNEQRGCPNEGQRRWDVSPRLMPIRNCMDRSGGSSAFCNRMALCT